MITKAVEAAFRTEMAEIKEKVDLQLINDEMYGEELGEKFEKVKLEDAKKFDNYLKLELIFWGDYDMSNEITILTNDFIKANAEEILGENTITSDDGTKYIKNLYFIDKQTAGGKEKQYLYDAVVDHIYKVPLTTIGKYNVHSVEELDFQRENGTDGRKSLRGTVITQESAITTVGNTAYYEPDLKGFIEEKTSIVYYKINSDGTVNNEEDIVPVTTYLGTKQRTEQKNNSEYDFYDYEKKLWANIKVSSSGVDTYWTWIPRYAYKIEGTETKVIYIDTSNKQALNGEALPDGYIVHSAFTENDKKGIWVSKYEVEMVQSNKVDEFPHYLPDLSGFDRENTYIEVYNDDGSFTETKLADINNIGAFAKNNRWFDYKNQIWANIKTKAYDAECWWVWIPRYAYRIPNTSEPVTQIIFVDKQDRPLSGEELPDGYIIHPAFEGGKKGIWVSKYEITKESDKPLNNANVPDLSGYNPDTTWIEVYKDDGTFEEVKLSTINNIEEFAKNNRWYDYSKQIWANIKTKVDGAECWWVWIPSYAYYLYDNDTRIIFLDENGNPKEGGTLPSHYTRHPVFEGKKGIWASKYEIGQDN